MGVRQYGEVLRVWRFYHIFGGDGFNKRRSGPWEAGVGKRAAGRGHWEMGIGKWACVHGGH